MTSAAERLSLAEARALFLAAQGLPGADRTVAEGLERGFVRTLGGVDVYLALRARVPGMRRADLDAAVENGDAQVVPAARGCIYLVPRAQVGVALRLAEQLSAARAAREHAKAGIRDGELDEVAAAVFEALADGPLRTAQLRRALPADTARSLGDAGKKVGLSSTLPPALRQLELRGRIERRLEGGRLDTERYLWRRTARNPFADTDVPDDPAVLHTRIAEVYLRAAGLGTVRQLAAWSGLALGAARAACTRLATVPVTVDGLDEPHLRLENGPGSPASEPVSAPRVALLPFEDNLIALHGGPAAMVDAEHHGLELPTWYARGRKTPLGEARHAVFRSVVAGGKVAGFWELEPVESRVVICLLGRPSTAERAAVEAAAEDFGRFVADQLGHGRSFSLDTDRALSARAEQLEALARG